MNRLPHWFRQDYRDLSLVKERISFFKDLRVNTVCESARCPNIGRCFKENSFTFMILGDTCTRNCSFCAVKKRNGNLKLDLSEPLRIVKTVSFLNLDYVVITSVTRDDLSDGGVDIFIKTVEAIQDSLPQMIIELLIPDFKGNFRSLERLIEVRPSIIGHNLETVRRLYKDIRPDASYQRSLELLRRIKELRPNIYTKSALLLGLGEEKEEILEAMSDLIGVGCDILVLGQYLAPSKEHFPVKRFVGIEEFQGLREVGLSLGFKVVSSGPLVRSSFQASKIYSELITSQDPVLYK